MTLKRCHTLVKDLLGPDHQLSRYYLSLVSAYSKHITLLNIGDSTSRRKPIVIVDVNLGKEKGKQKLIIYHGDDPRSVAEKFAETFCNSYYHFNIY
jgi:hypothetical protein